MSTPLNLPHYGWQNEQPLCSCAYLEPIVLELVKKLKPKRVLDLGAGNGALCDKIDKLGIKVVGIDCDVEGCCIAQKNYPEIPFYTYSVESDPKKLLDAEEKFDVVVSTEVVEHLYAPHLLPIYAAAVLKESGSLIISTPYHGYFKNLAIALLNKWDFHHTALWHGGHIKFWSKKTLTALLTQNGFDVLEFHGAGRLPYLWKSMVLVAKKRST